MITVDCGIGIIEYKEPDNLKLQMLMELLAEKIIKDGADKVLEALS